MFELIRSDPPAGQVRRITFVPFLRDGRCVLVEGPAGPELPATTSAKPSRHQAPSWTSAALDVGCANGLLMESMAAWCAERALALEPHGVDLAPGLVGVARQRLPQWADRIWVGNAIDWAPPQGQRFDYVHVLLDCVPARRHADLIRHHLTTTVRPRTGRLLVSDYVTSGPTAAQTLHDLGFTVAGQSSGARLGDRPPAPTAWIDV